MSTNQDKTQLVQNELNKSVLDAAESFGDLMNTALPEPIKRNLLKALNQLCTAAVDIPVAYLESKASEIRAESKARVKVINETGNQLACKLDVNENYAIAAQEKYAAKIIRKQLNIDIITKKAIKELQNISNGSIVESKEKVPELNNDWLNAFELEAANKSTEEMQTLFGRILAGEICKPTSFSIRTVKLLSQIDSRTAEIFVKLCSLCCTHELAEGVYDSRVISLGSDARYNSLLKYGLFFAHLNILQEHGLIITDYHSWCDFIHCIEGNSNTKISFNGSLWQLRADSPALTKQPLRIEGVALTTAGAELLKIVEIIPDEEYTSELEQYLKTLGFTLIPAN